MSRLIEEGKVRLGGVSNFDVALLERCEAIRHVDSLQSPFSLIHREIAASEIPWCAQHETGVLCYSPMQSGLLTDTFTRRRVRALAPDDWRRRSQDFNEPKLSANLALRDALIPIARRHATSVAAVAVAWAAAWPGVSAKQVDGWIGGGSLQLTSADFEEISSAIEGHAAGDAKADPIGFQDDIVGGAGAA